MLKATAFAVFMALTFWLGLCLGAAAAEQIPCWKAQALLVWAGGNEAKAEKIARKHGYTRAQIAEVRGRCHL